MLIRHTNVASFLFWPNRAIINDLQANVNIFPSISRSESTLREVRNFTASAANQIRSTKCRRPRSPVQSASRQFGGLNLVRKRGRKMKAIIITFAMIVFGSIGAYAAPADIDGIQWTLTYANGREVTGSIAYFEIERNGERFTGNTGCNRMFGTVGVRGQKIDFSGIGSTRMMCKLPAGSVSETAFLNALDKADKFARNGNVLYVFDRRGRTILRFKRLVKQAPVDEPSELRQLGARKWVLESIRDRKTFAPIKGVFINFDAAKGSAGGDSGCNVFGGEYTVKGDKIEISDIVSTMRACVEDGKMAVERDFFDGLRAANRFDVSDGRLRLFRGKTLLLTLRGERKN